MKVPRKRSVDTNTMTSAKHGDRSYVEFLDVLKIGWRRVAQVGIDGVSLSVAGS